MTHDPHSTQRRARILAELADLGMTLARDLAARAAETETPEDAQALAQAFQQVSRAVRLSLALEVRLAEEAVNARKAAVQARKAEVKAKINRAIDETKGLPTGERFSLYAALGERLDVEIHDERFLSLPVEVCIARIRKDLGLPPQDPPAPVSSPSAPAEEKANTLAAAPPPLESSERPLIPAAGPPAPPEEARQPAPSG